MSLPIENAEFLRLLRQSGWHQARAARELGVTTATVSRYCSGAIKPSLPVLRLFADTLGERLLLEGEPVKSPVRDGPRYLEEWEDEVLLVLRRIPRDARQQAIAALRQLVDAISGSLRYVVRRHTDPQPGSDVEPTHSVPIDPTAQPPPEAKVIVDALRLAVEDKKIRRRKSGAKPEPNQ